MPVRGIEGLNRFFSFKHFFRYFLAFPFFPFFLLCNSNFNFSDNTCFIVGPRRIVRGGKRNDGFVAVFYEIPLCTSGCPIILGTCPGQGNSFPIHSRYAKIIYLIRRDNGGLWPDFTLPLACLEEPIWNPGWPAGIFETLVPVVDILPPGIVVEQRPGLYEAIVPLGLECFFIFKETIGHGGPLVQHS